MRYRVKEAENTSSHKAHILPLGPPALRACGVEDSERRAHESCVGASRKDDVTVCSRGAGVASGVVTAHSDHIATDNDTAMSYLITDH